MGGAGGTSFPDSDRVQGSRLLEHLVGSSGNGSKEPEVSDKLKGMLDKVKKTAGLPGEGEPLDPQQLKQLYERQQIRRLV